MRPLAEANGLFCGSRPLGQKLHHASLEHAVANREHVVTARDNQCLRTRNKFSQRLRRTGNTVDTPDRDQKRNVEAANIVPA